MTTVVLDGESLTLEQVLLFREPSVKVTLSPEADNKINRARGIVEKIVKSGDIVYGINTGFGALSSVTIPEKDLTDLQHNLIRSHACAVGERMIPEHVIMMMVIRANSLAKGHSGARLETVQQLLDMVNSRIAPVIPSIGSLGSSGDLAPLSHMTLGMMGEGDSLVLNQNGDWVQHSSLEALKMKGLQPISLVAKEGLSLINGTSQMCTYLALTISNMEKLAFTADVALACSVEGIKGSHVPFDQRIHQARPQRGQMISSTRTRLLLEGSEINKSHKNCERVQDSYSFRCAPQVHGAALESILEGRRILEIELNSATDNPLIFIDGDDYEVFSGGNFHGQVLSQIGDALAISCHEFASISERRINQIMDPQWSSLPAFLAKQEGLESGLMIVQYVSAAVIAELNLLSNSVSTTNISVSMGKEDHNSMGSTSCRRALRCSELLSLVLSAELISACESMDLLEQSSSNAIEKVRNFVRTNVEPLSRDRSLTGETESLASLLIDGKLLDQLG